MLCAAADADASAQMWMLELSYKRSSARNIYEEKTENNWI